MLLLLLVVVVAVLTPPLRSFDLQELAAMSGHRIPLHQGSDGAHIPQSFVKGKQFGGEVERSEASARATQPALLFTGQRGDCATQQRIWLHGGA